MAQERVYPLDALRTDGWFERVASTLGSFDALCEILGEQVFASTIQASMSGDAPPDELDDAEIERSIREINEAIQRSSQRKN